MARNLDLVSEDLVWKVGGFRVSQMQAEAAWLQAEAAWQEGEQVLQDPCSVFGNCWPVLNGFWRYLDSAQFDQFDGTYRVWKDQPNLAAAAAGQAFMAAGRALTKPTTLRLVFNALASASNVWEAQTVLRGTEEVRLRTTTSILYATYELQGAEFLDQFYFLHLFSGFDPRHPYRGYVLDGPLVGPADLSYVRKS